MDCKVPTDREDYHAMEDGMSVDTVRELSAQLKRLSEDGAIPPSRPCWGQYPRTSLWRTRSNVAYHGRFGSCGRLPPGEDAKAELSKCTIPLKEELLQSQDL
jgi:hypothetical protein